MNISVRFSCQGFMTHPSYFGTKKAARKIIVTGKEFPEWNFVILNGRVRYIFKAIVKSVNLEPFI